MVAVIVEASCAGKKSSRIVAFLSVRMLDKRMPTYRLTLVPCQFAILTLLLVGLLSTHLPTVNATLDASDARNDTGQVSRTRRQLYGGDDYYGSYYGWYVF